MSRSGRRPDIEKLVTAGHLQRVPESVDFAKRLLSDASAHVGLARRGVEDDPAGALQLAYDASRKGCSALLATYGLRATVRGGHVAVIDAVCALTEDSNGAEVFERLHALRRRRNRTEYPDPNSPGVTVDDALHALRTAAEVLATVERLVDVT